MNKIVFYILPALIICSCAKDAIESHIPVEIDEVPVISITAGRTEGNFVLSESMAASAGTKAAPGKGVFDKDIEVDCYETVILPSDVPHLWAGNVVKKNSIAGHLFTPVSGQKSPITLSSSLYGVTPREINRPSNSAYLSYVNSVIESGNFSQYGEFSYSVEQFSSYNEIKKAFGSDVNTGIIFFSSGSSESTSNHSISRATGIYLKFYQTNFRVFMDEPDDYIPSASMSDRENSVYVNSIAYGRLGILAMETNYSAEEAMTQVNKVINRLFVKGSKDYTSEEKAFLESCEFKLFMIGGEGESDVTCFTGLEAFIANVNRGSFSMENPGVPILCTFNNLSDHSPFNIRFVIKYEKDPLYVELVAHDCPPAIYHNGERNISVGDIYIHFYRNEYRNPAIAPKGIEVLIEEIEEAFDPKYSIIKRTRRVHNTAGQTEVLWRINAPGYIYIPLPDNYPMRVQGAQKGVAMRPQRGGEYYYTYSLLPSEDYRILGFPISGAIYAQYRY